jgi:hypothetical protein
LEEKSQTLIGARNTYQKNVTRPESPFRRPRPSFRSKTSEKEAEGHINPTRKETKFG